MDWICRNLNIVSPNIYGETLTSSAIVLGGRAIAGGDWILSKFNAQ